MTHVMASYGSKLDDDRVVRVVRVDVRVGREKIIEKLLLVFRYRLRRLRSLFFPFLFWE